MKRKTTLITLVLLIFGASMCVGFSGDAKHQGRAPNVSIEKEQSETAITNHDLQIHQVDIMAYANMQDWTGINTKAGPQVEAPGSAGITPDSQANSQDLTAKRRWQATMTKYHQVLSTKRS